MGLPQELQKRAPGVFSARQEGQSKAAAAVCGLTEATWPMALAIRPPTPMPAPRPMPIPMPAPAPPPSFPAAFSIVSKVRLVL